MGSAFARGAAGVSDGATVVNFPGVVATVQQVVEAIEKAVPAAAGRIDWADVPLPFPAEFEATGLEGILGPLPKTTLVDGVTATIDRFQRL